MVRPKDYPAANWFRELQERWEAKRLASPIVAVRWYVVEEYPAYRDSDEYSNFWVSAKSTKVSPWFETESEARAWADKHVPDNSTGTLAVKHQNRRVITTEEWVNW